MPRRGPSEFASMDEVGRRAGGAAHDDLPLSRLAISRAWRSAVGEKLSSETRPISLSRGSLVVEVSSAAWGRAMEPLKSEILSRLNDLVPGAGLTTIRLRVGSGAQGVVKAAPIERPRRDRRATASPDDEEPALSFEAAHEAIRDEKLRLRFSEVARRYLRRRGRFPRSSS